MRIICRVPLAQALALIVGYVEQSLSLSMKFSLAGLAITLLVRSVCVSNSAQHVKSPYVKSLQTAAVFFSRIHAQVCVPNWPCFNKNALAWQPPVGDAEVTCVEDDEVVVAAVDSAPAVAPDVIAANIARLEAKRLGTSKSVKAK